MDIVSYLRQFRIEGFAIFDFATAFVGIAVLSPLLSWIFKKAGLEIPKKNWLFLTVPIGIVAHLIIGRNTPLTAEFLDPLGHYVLKIIVVGLVICGLRGIRKVSK